MTHCNTVVDGYGIELGRKATLLLYKALYVLSYFVQVYVSGNHLCERIGNADYGHSHLLLCHSIGAP